MVQLDLNKNKQEQSWAETKFTPHGVAKQEKHQATKKFMFNQVIFGKKQELFDKQVGKEKIIK